MLGVCLAAAVSAPLAQSAPAAVAGTRTVQADDAQGCPAGNVCFWSFRGYTGTKEVETVGPACVNLKEKTAAADNNSTDAVQIFQDDNCRSGSVTVKPGEHGSLNESTGPLSDTEISEMLSFRKK
jgi:hypothetical protein